MDKFKSMRIFCRVVELGSLTAAAREWDLSPTMVGKHVTQLEKELGLSLLTRTTRRLSLTEAGRGYYQRSKQLLEDLEELENSVSALGEGTRGTLIVAAPIDFGLMYLVPAVTAYRQSHPKVALSLTLENRFIDLSSGDFDLVIRITDTPHHGMIAKQITSTELCTFASPGYLAAHGEPRTITDLHQHQCLGFINTPHGNHWLFHDNGRSIEFKCHWQFASNNGTALCEAAAMDMGIIQVPSTTAKPYLADGRLKEILLDFCVKDLPIYAFYLQRRFIPAKITTFVRFLQTYFSEQ
ncbi:MAG: LysR family transcriptional regulator [Methylothermaceae bacteria B42]|nr:MAG: LysR family transcriptional regulator [Methylothermaceae bacteria B42]HHJ38940.1 LysR family transcriptional regulator [Methylothermaceae bacterium]